VRGELRTGVGRGWTGCAGIGAALLERGRGNAGIVLAFSVLAAAPALAQDGRDFFGGRELTMLATSAPGGGYDWFARTVGRFMSRFIPGNPTFVVRNMTGAGGLVAANHLYSVAAKDGSVMAILDRSVLTVPLLYGSDSKTRYEAMKFSWVGNAARERGMGVVSTRARATNLDSMRNVEVAFGAHGAETEDALYARVFNVLYGTHMKVIPGYPGQREILMAVEKGELDGQFFSGWSGINTAYVKERMTAGQMKLFVQMSADRDPEFPDVPTILDVIRDPDDQLVVQMLLSRLALGRPFLAPPGVPPDRLAVLQTAFRRTMEDSDFLSEARKSGFDIDPIYAAEAKEMIGRLYQSPASVLRKVRAIVKPNQN